MNHLRSMTLERIITKAWTTDYRIHAGLWDHSYVSYVCFPFSFILSSRRQHVNTSCDGWIDGSSYVGYTHLVGEKIPYSTNLSSEDPSSTPNYRHRTLVVVSQYLYSQRTSSHVLQVTCSDPRFCDFVTFLLFMFRRRTCCDLFFDVALVIMSERFVSPTKSVERKSKYIREYCRLLVVYDFRRSCHPAPLYATASACDGFRKCPNRLER
jgi:hypothetical protein